MTTPVLIPDLQTITSEILVLKRLTAANIIEIGRRLIQAKELVGHGNWLAYLRENVQLGERTAQRFMKASQEFADHPTALSDLSPSHIYQLLEAPEEDRERLADQARDMTTRDLEEAVRELKQAKRQAEELQGRVTKAEQRAEASEMAPPQVVERTVEVVKPDPEQAAEMSRLRQLLNSTQRDLDNLRRQADKNGALDEEIRAKEQHLGELAAMEQELSARFSEDDRDPKAGMELLQVITPIYNAVLDAEGRVGALAARGVGGWCDDERIRDASKRFRRLADALDSILADRAARPIEADFREVR